MSGQDDTAERGQTSICRDCAGGCTLREFGRDDQRVTCNRCSGTGREFVAQPLTWDGEPLWSPSTVAETLFAREAFAQMRGQIALEVDDASE